MADPVRDWDAAAVRRWLHGRVAAARAEQVAAEREGRAGRDACDQAAAEEMVCLAVAGERATTLQAAFVQELRDLLARDDYVWRGVYDDDRFERHVRTYIRKLIGKARANAGFERLGRYQ